MEKEQLDESLKRGYQAMAEENLQFAEEMIQSVCSTILGGGFERRA